MPRQPSRRKPAGTTGRRARSRNAVPRTKGPRSRERHWLYQEAVQSPEVHFGFFDRVYRSTR